METSEVADYFKESKCFGTNDFCNRSSFVILLSAESRFKILVYIRPRLERPDSLLYIHFPVQSFSF